MAEAGLQTLADSSASVWNAVSATIEPTSGREAGAPICVTTGALRPQPVGATLSGRVAEVERPLEAVATARTT